MSRWNRNFGENGGYIGASPDATCYPLWDTVAFALSGHGTAGVRPTKDLVGNDITWSGDANIATANGTPPIYSTSIGVGNGSITPPTSILGFGANREPFTLRFKVWLNDLSVARAILDIANGNSNWGPNDQQFVAYFVTDATFRWQWWDGSQVRSLQPANSTPALNTWTDYVVCYDGTNTWMYRNAILLGTAGGDYSWFNPPNRRMLVQSNGNNPFAGQIQEFVLHKGVCLHPTALAGLVRPIQFTARRYPSGVFKL